MKWFKHMTDGIDDPFIQSLLDKFSHAGYVAWFGLIEIIAKENGNNVTGNLDISPTFLKRKLRISQTKLREIFGFCSTNAKLLFDFSKEKWHFEFHKIAEIKDNYTKDLQASGKKPSIEAEEEAKKKKKEDKYKDKRKRKRKAIHGKPTENPSNPLDTGVSEAQNLANFNAFYAAYPKHKAKQDALKAWTALTPNEALLPVILEALKKHKTCEEWLKDGGKYIPLPASWLRGRRWEDEISPQNDWRNNPKGTPLPDRTRHNLAVMDALAREREEKATEQKKLQEGEKENERLGEG